MFLLYTNFEKLILNYVSNCFQKTFLLRGISVSLVQKKLQEIIDVL